MARPYSMDLRSRALAACDEGERPSAVARRFKVARDRVPVARAAPRRGAHRGRAARRGGPKPVIRDGVAEALVRLVEGRNDLTPAEYADGLEAETGVRAAPAMLCRALQRLGLCREKKTPRATERDGEAVQRARADWRAALAGGPGGRRWRTWPRGAAGVHRRDRRADQHGARLRPQPQGRARPRCGAVRPLAAAHGDRRARVGGRGRGHGHRGRHERRRVRRVSGAGAAAGAAPGQARCRDRHGRSQRPRDAGGARPAGAVRLHLPRPAAVRARPQPDRAGLPGPRTRRGCVRPPRARPRRRTRPSARRWTRSRRATPRASSATPATPLSECSWKPL